MYKNYIFVYKADQFLLQMTLKPLSFECCKFFKLNNGFVSGVSFLRRKKIIKF